MAELSALGIKVTSSGVVKTTNELTAFAKAARAAGTAAKPIGVKVNSADVAKSVTNIKAMSTAITQSGTAARQADAHMKAYRASQVSAAAASWEKSMAAKAAANADVRAANQAWAAAKAADALSRSTTRASVALKSQATAATQATAAVKTSTGAMKANTSNIAAQFQDVGVTAAMGMNPLIIGLQQGTQLSAVFAQSGQSMGQVLAGAFRQIASAQALMTIGIVAGAAALLQMVDWASLAQSALNGLADVLVDIAPYAVAAAGALALIYAPAIIGGIVALTKRFLSLAAAMLATLPIPVLIVAGLTAIVAAANYFRDELTQVLGFDIVQAAKDGVNYIVGFFVGAYNGIVATWNILPRAIGDVVIQAANATLKAVEGMVNGTIGLINGLTSKLPFGLGEGLGIGGVSFGAIANPNAGMGAAASGLIKSNIAAAQSVDWVGIAIKKVKAIAGDAAGWLRNLAKGLAGDSKDSVGKSAKDSAKEIDQWAKLLEDVAKQARDLTQAGQRIGVYGMALAEMTFQQELLNKALDAGIEPTEKQRQTLAKMGTELAKLSEDNRHKQFWEDFKNTSNEQISTLQQQRVELGLTGEALYEYQFFQDAVNKAMKEHITLTAADIALIRERAQAAAQQKVQLDAQEDAMRAANDNQRERLRTIKGAFFDFFDAIREGGNVFKAFADSVINALNRIIDKMLDSALDNLFGGKGGGGILGGLFGGGNSLAASAASTIAANPAIFAKGGAFGVPHKFAKGGSFTNSVVSSPTLFRFANGGALGEMGEAGPEAIMPLKRGPDGSLGVQSHGNDNNIHVSVSVDNGGGLRAFVTNQAGAIVAQSAPVIADAGSKQAQSRIAHRNTRRLA